MSPLPVVRTVPDLRHAVAQWRREGCGVGLVPTMGALHEGHLSLIDLAAERCDRVVVSLFVNPAQFGPDEDFAAYPRNEAGDAALLAARGCHLLYAPSPATIYPPGFSTAVTVKDMTADLEGAFRPTHFAGVATVVAKLLVQAAPDVAVFGEKDYQQLQLIRRLVRDLDLPVRIVGGPIVRDPDGLALSSRNLYLTAEERRVAPSLRRVLAQTAASLSEGTVVEVAEAAGVAALRAAGFGGIDYLEARDPESLARAPAGPLTRSARLLCAARLGRVRLLDNIAIDLEGAA